MENAAEALKMVAAFLVFIIAIGTSFSIFGTAKQTADSIIGMRDKQAYLEAAELDNGILYTSSTAIQGDTTGLSESEIEAQKKQKSSITGVTKNGDRIVEINDIISTIYRYSKEKYGVTIVEQDGTVLARFDSATEAIMTQWYNIADGEDAEGNPITATEQKKNYAEKINERIYNKYLDSQKDIDLKSLYNINVEGNTNIRCGAPWYGNEEQIQKRIDCELSGDKYTYNGQSFQRTKGLLDILKAPNIEQIVEVTNEIDNSKYLKEDVDGDGKGDTQTDLLQQYEMPTIEIIYIIMNS